MTCEGCRKEFKPEELYDSMCVRCNRAFSGACEWCGSYNCPYIYGADCPELLRLQELYEENERAQQELEAYYANET